MKFKLLSRNVLVPCEIKILIQEKKLNMNRDANPDLQVSSIMLYQLSYPVSISGANLNLLKYDNLISQRTNNKFVSNYNLSLNAVVLTVL